MSETFEVVVKILYGLEEILAEKLLALGANDLQIGRHMVSLMGDKGLLYRASFHCCAALRTLKPIYHSKARDANAVYKEVKKVEWEKYSSLDKTFAIDSVIYSEDFNHSKSVVYRTKDTIVDYFIEKPKKHPSVRVNNPDLYINVHISYSDCTLSIDSSGESLHRCGCRVDRMEALLNEVLAVGMTLKTGWKGEPNFVDPTCGSGTLLIEAAMIALNTAPGIHRKEFTFQKWMDYDEELPDRIYNDESEERESVFHCYGPDISQTAIDIALENIRNAGSMKYIDPKVKPLQQYTEALEPGMLVASPPYGGRISFRDLLRLCNMIGERLEYMFMGYKAWILSCKDECFDKVGLRPNEKIKLMNGSSEYEYRCYESSEGTNKDFKRTLNKDGEERPRRSEGSFERRDNDRRNFRTGCVDRPKCHFVTVHSEDDEERLAPILGKRIFRRDRGGDRPAHKKLVDAPTRKPIKPRGERPVKMRYRDEDDHKGRFGDHKRDGKRLFSKLIKPIKRRGYDDYED